MSVTVNDAFMLSLALCEALDKNGNASFDDCVGIWKTKCVPLCDICQNELSLVSPVYETVRIDCSKEPELSDNKTKQFLIDERLISVLKTACSDESLVPVIRDGRVCVSYDFNGIVTLFVTMSPLSLTSLQSVFSVSGNVIKSLVPYYLAANFLLEENPSRASFYFNLFCKGKELLKPCQTSSEETVDVYGGVFSDAL